MNETTLSIYKLLQDILKDVWEQQKYSEVKNGVILTLNIAILTISVRVYFEIKEIINSNFYSKSIFIILIILFIIHIIFILQSFFPKDRSKENFKDVRNIMNINIFFFGDIQKVENTYYLDLIIKKIESDKSEKINRNLLLDLSYQVVKLSEITNFKYTSFKKSIQRMYLLGSLFILYIGWLLLLNS